MMNPVIKVMLTALQAGGNATVEDLGLRAADADGVSAVD